MALASWLVSRGRFGFFMHPSMAKRALPLKHGKFKLRHYPNGGSRPARSWTIALNERPIDDLFMSLAPSTPLQILIDAQFDHH